MRALALLLLFPLVAVPVWAQTPDAGARPRPSVRKAATGHVTNYDESKVGSYLLPDPLAGKDGRPVRDAGGWAKQRRRLIRLFESEIFGRVPGRAPKLTFTTVQRDRALDGKAVWQRMVGRLGDGPDAPQVHAVVHLPATAPRPVPVVLRLVLLPLEPAVGRPTFEDDPVAEILARGYGHAALRVVDLEPDDSDRVRLMALSGGRTKLADDEWSKTAAWAWGASRFLDHLIKERDIDALRVLLVGHSRFGRAALWAGALDPRFAMLFASCSGEMSTAISRRDFGQTVDDLVETRASWFAGNFRKYAGHWNDLPVDAHTLLALQAPRPIFLTAGSEDQGGDPRGMFLAAVAAEPVYRLLGAAGLGAKELPPLDAPVISGNIGFLYHTGGHALLASDWRAFLDFADRHLRRR